MMYHFSKNDAHIVSIKDNIIGIIGKDTDVYLED